MQDWENQYQIMKFELNRHTPLSNFQIHTNKLHYKHLTFMNYHSYIRIKSERFQYHKSPFDKVMVKNRACGGCLPLDLVELGDIATIYV